MKKIKVGIIGMGYIGESHIEAVRRIGFCELYAIADTNAELARAKAEYYGIEKCYLSVDELLSDPDIDAVHNCTPNFLHLEINKKIIKSGKHLLSEKPLCRSYAEACELVELKKQYPNSAAAVNFNYRKSNVNFRGLYTVILMILYVPKGNPLARLRSRTQKVRKE